MKEKPVVYVIAGPNGAGKTTFDNSGRLPALVFEEREGKLVIHDKEVYGIIAKEVGS